MQMINKKDLNLKGGGVDMENNYKSISEMEDINVLQINEGEYITDKLKNIPQIDNNEDIILNCPLGSGKTYWALNTLLKNASLNYERVLYVVHRRTCLFQMMDDVAKAGVRVAQMVDFRTMQSLFHNELREDGDVMKSDLDQYSHIIIDESHSIMNSGWTKTNQEIFDIIMSTKARKVFISATNEDFILYMVNRYKFKQDNIFYAKDNHYNIDKMFLYEAADLDNIVENLYNKEDEKSLVIINDVEQLEEYSKLYTENTMFGLSKGNDMHEKIGEKYVGEFKTMLKNKKFPENIKICFSTTFIDAGISIFDEQFKNILIYNVGDINTIKQITGRKRKIDKNDKVNVYIDNRSKGKMGAILRELEDAVEYVEEFKEKLEKDKDVDSVIFDHFLLENRNPKVGSYIYVKPEGEEVQNVRDVDIRKVDRLSIKINEVSHYYNVAHIYKIEDYKDIGWVGILAREFSNDNIIEIERHLKIQGIEKKLNQLYHKAVRFYDIKEKNELAKIVDYRIGGKLKKGMKNINHALETEKIPFRVVSRRESTIDMHLRVEKEEELFRKRKIRKKDIKDYRRNYWIIESVENLKIKGDD